MSSGAKQVMEQQYKGLRESIRIKCSCSKPICLIHIQLNLHTISSLCIFLPYPWFSNMVFPPVFFVTITPSRCFPPIFFPSCCVCVCMWGGGTALHFCPMKPVLQVAWGVMVHVCYEGGQDWRRQGFGPSRPILPEPAALLHFNTNTAAADLPWHAGGLSVCAAVFLHTYV